VPADVSVIVTLFSRDAAAARGGAAVEPDVLVRTSPPVHIDRAPLRVQTVPFERFLPQLKNVATLGLTYFPRRAAADGFDDVLFVDRRGHVSEASIWNLALWDGEAVVWPDAAMLEGTTMQLVRRALHRDGGPSRTQPVAVGDLGDFRAAALMNSWSPGVAVDVIDDVTLPGDAAFLALLHGAYESHPLEPL
jgi:branched-subunit amino acid aminotransferase/4-amino-4-deoxychorismate lyase